METTAPRNISSNSEISNSLGGTLNNAASSAHAALDSIAGAADEAARRAKPAIDRVAAVAHQAVDKTAGAVAPTAEWLTEHGENLNAAQKRLVADTCSFISDNPLKSIGIAMLAGFLLSRIVLR